MGALRIKEADGDILEKDPYELFSLEERPSFGRRFKPGTLAAAGCGLVLAFVGAGVTFWQSQRDAHNAEGEPFAYFEVKAIDPDGRPVAGAVVKDDQRQLGVTDSFGEWRRFMRVKPGSTVHLTLAKKVGATTYTAAKNLAVPLKAKNGGDIEVSGSVQLAQGSPAKAVAKAKATPDAATAVIDSAGDDAVTSAHLTPETGGPLGGEATLADADATFAAAESAGAIDPRADAEQSVAPASADRTSAAQAFTARTSAATAPSLDLSRVWFTVAENAPEALFEVLAAVRRRARELGLKLDPNAPWHVTFSHLPTKATASGASGLIRVDGFAGESRLYSFLRNYQEQPLQAARDILWSTVSHVSAPQSAVKHGDAYYLEPVAPALFTLTPGRSVTDREGRVFGVEREGERLRLTGDSAPAGCATACALATAGLAKAPPVPGWQRLGFKVLGSVGPNTELYVSGYAAERQGDGTFRYWGIPASGANVTVVRDGRIALRTRLEPSAASGLPAMILPSAPLSRK